ncbi:dehydrogenase [Arthrobacter crystallopoietes BAB-32]|uniref:Dehydrogenase n=1 Tax=Arthrobacter crystallopoietes BAB-32 TaxID=1246476 RepID=N1UVL3_9MICC|nr:dehydrogenase [Arthrobacter crystallopoietes BAB-32]
MLAANRLAANRALAALVAVQIINPRPDFVERIRLHQVATGTRESAAVPLASLLHPKVALVVGTAALIDPVEQTIHFADGREPLSYDTLLYAAGSASAPSAGADYSLQDTESAGRLRAGLEGLATGAVVNVVGGGLTGIEAASEIAEKHPRLIVRLVSRGTVGADLSRGGQQALRSRLASLGVEIMDRTEVEHADGRHLRTSSGAILPGDCTVWTAGFSTPDLARNSGLPTDPQGRLLVDETLAVPGHPHIFGAGDGVLAAASIGAHLRMACAVAMPMGAHAADNIAANLQQRTPLELSVGFILRCISLGRSAGLVQAVHADDRPRPLALRGRMGAMVKEQVCRMTLSWIRKEARGGSYGWPKGPRPAAEPQLAEAR